MDVFGNNKDLCREYLNEAVYNPDIELEFIYGEHFFKENINKETFIRILKKCREHFTPYSDNYSLDIQLEYYNKRLQKQGIGNIRTRIVGLDSIKRYCKTDSLENLSYERVKKSNSKSFKQPDLNYRINKKSEVTLSETDPDVVRVMNQWSQDKKYFRFKKTTSFITEDRLFRIDLSGVKSTYYNSKSRQYDTQVSFRDSNVLNQPETYELEMEYIGHSLYEPSLTNFDVYLKKLELDIPTDVETKSSFNIFDYVVAGEISFSSTKGREYEDYMNMEEYSPGDLLEDEDKKLIGERVYILPQYFEKDDVLKKQIQGRKIAYVDDVRSNFELKPDKYSTRVYPGTWAKIIMDDDTLVDKNGRSFKETYIPITMVYLEESSSWKPEPIPSEKNISKKPVKK